MRWRRTVAGVAAGAMVLGGASTAGAQPAFPIVPPKLPPRGAAIAQPAANQPQPAYGTATAAPATYATAPAARTTAVTAPPAATVTASPRAAAGTCRVLPSPERQSLALVTGDPPLPREHVPLGEFRAQQVVHSADGRWAVAFTKLRGAPRFAALTLDLERCSVQNTIELPGAGSAAAFDGDQAVLRYEGGERRVSLVDGSVR